MIVIRSCDADGRSRGGFIWPLEVGLEPNTRYRLNDSGEFEEVPA